MHNPQKTTKKMEGRQSIAYSFGRVFALAAALCAASASALTLNDGLAVYLPFNNSLTENAVAGSPVTPEASTATPPALVNNGMIGKCLDIPSGAYVKLTGSDSATLANNSLGFEDSNKSFTAIIWANHGALDNDPVVFANKNWGGTAKGALLCAKTVSNKPTVQFNAANGSARIDKTASDTQFTGEGAGKWTFYAMVGKSGSFTMYQGKSDGTFTSKNKSLSSFDMDTGYPFVLGQQGDCNYNRIFTGQLDDFALWNRALSSDDIRRIYECGRAGMELGDILKIDANDEPTMEVAASDNDSATLSFGGRRGSAHTLFVAYGADDAGKDKFAWSGFMPIAEIAPDTAEYTYTFPDLFKAASTRYRFFLMQTNNLPYVKEVTYAHSDGTAYIDSGIAPRRHLIADFDMQFTGDNTEWGTGKTSSQTAIYENIFGAFCGTDKRGNYGICRYRKAGDSNNNMLDRECNGYANARIADALAPLLDAANIDLKGFTDAYYRWCGGDLAPVQATIRRLAAEPGCHLEVTCLIVGGHNDDPEEMRRLSGWLASVDPDIVLHVTRCFPRWKMAGAAPTPVEVVYALADVAREQLAYVVVGNC